MILELTWITLSVYEGHLITSNTMFGKDILAKQWEQSEARLFHPPGQAVAQSYDPGIPYTVFIC